MATRAPKSFFKKWVKALRSGEYTQARMTLKAGESYCCLGVACVLKGRQHKKNPGLYAIARAKGLNADEGNYWDGYAGKWLMPLDEQNVLSDLNDSGASFQEIADYIEKKYLNA